MTSSSQLAGKRSSISRASRVLYSRFVKLGASDGCTELACSKSKMYVSMSVIRCNPEFKMEEKIPQSLCLWGNKKLEPQNKDDKVGNILEQNNLNRLQMVQFECPWIINPSSCSFGRFALQILSNGERTRETPFSVCCRTFRHRLLSAVIRNGLLWEAIWEKLEIFWNKFSSAGCK